MILEFQRRGDFYVIEGEPAQFVADALGLVVTRRDGVPSVGIPAHWDINEWAESLRLAGADGIRIEVPPGGVK